VLKLVGLDSSLGPLRPRPTDSFVFKEWGTDHCAIEHSVTGKRMLLVRLP
jgi:hypothetical protein